MGLNNFNPLKTWKQQFSSRAGLVELISLKTFDKIRPDEHDGCGTVNNVKQVSTLRVTLRPYFLLRWSISTRSTRGRIFPPPYLKYTTVCGRTSAAPSILCTDSSSRPPRSSEQTPLRRWRWRRFPAKRVDLGFKHQTPAEQNTSSVWP